MMLLKYFAAQPDTSWQIKENVKAMIQFKVKNLLEEYTSLGKFDLIFVRNVLIYFDEATKAEITAKMAKSLPPHGILILGSTETLIDPTGLFVALPDFRGAYKLKS
jgi:chemotaxis protein methyltransferase CheR